MISFEHFRKAVAWLASEDVLMAELDAYKADSEQWSRRNTTDLCRKLAYRSSGYWSTTGYPPADTERTYPYLRTVVHSYIHAQDPAATLTQRKIVREQYDRYRRYQTRGQRT
ncbi:MAG: hypothetical protein AAF441_22955 [Pseudomonadota bacterium]